MKAQLIHDQQNEKTYAVIFDKGDEVVSGLQEFAQQNTLTAAHFTAVGAFSDVTLGYFERARREYKHIPLDEQVEVLSLVGNIALNHGAPQVHAHVVVGKSDGTAHGGHLLAAQVWPTLEVIIVESPTHLQRRMDEETGLALMCLSAADPAVKGAW